MGAVGAVPCLSGTQKLDIFYLEGQNWSSQNFLCSDTASKIHWFLIQNCLKHLFSGSVSAWLLLTVAVWIRTGSVGIRTRAESCQTSNKTRFWGAPSVLRSRHPSLILPARTKRKGDSGGGCTWRPKARLPPPSQKR